jgi:hypothetical protein
MKKLLIGLLFVISACLFSTTSQASSTNPVTIVKKASDNIAKAIASKEISIFEIPVKQQPVKIAKPANQICVTVTATAEIFGVEIEVSVTVCF